MLLKTSLFSTLSVTLSPPLAYELLNNAALVSTSLFRVQSLGSRTLICPESVFKISMPFSWAITEEEPKAVSGIPWREYLLVAYKPVVSLLLAVLFIFFVVRPLLRRREYAPSEAPMIPGNPTPALAAEGSPAIKAGDMREQTLQLAQGNPTKTVGIVKSWLNEKD